MSQVINGKAHVIAQLKTSTNKFLSQYREAIRHHSVVATTRLDDPYFLALPDTSAESDTSQKIRDKESAHQDLLKEYQKQLNENLDLLNSENYKYQQKMQQITESFEKIASYKYYYPHNNLENVMHEFYCTHFKKEEIRASGKIRYDHEVIQELIEFFSIELEMKTVKLVDKKRLRKYLTYQQKTIFEMDRQERKQKNNLKTPQQAVKKVTQMVSTVKKIQTAGHHSCQSGRYNTSLQKID